MADQRLTIIRELQSIRNIERINKQPFKVAAYSKVIKELEKLDKSVQSIEDLDGIQGIGKGIREKIIEILDKGRTQKIIDVDPTSIEAINLFLNIMSVGPVKARSLVEDHQIKTIEELRQHTDLLNDKQKIGLKYFEDFNERIPRKEMEKHKEMIKACVDEVIKERGSKLRFEITGSFRRGLSSSGDIDVLITGPDPKSLSYLVEALQSKKYLKDEFAMGEKKYNGVARLPRFKRHRRIDIMYTDEKRFPFALLYFTGSKEFNVEMRNVALEQGYSLNEYGLTVLNTKQDVPTIFKDEEDIFRFLRLQYVEPPHRKSKALNYLL